MLAQDPQAGDQTGGGGSAWTRPPPRKGRWLRRLLLAGVVLLVLLAVLLIFAPALASRFAPGYVQRTINEGIPGRIEIRTLDLGWGGPTVAGPVLLFDEQGRPIAEVEVTLPAGLWTVLSERWWAQRRFTLGTVVIRGNADIVRGADGRTNIERALGIGQPQPQPAPAPRPSPQPAEMPPAGLEEFTGTIRIADLDATFVDRTAPAGAVTAQGLTLRDLSGDIVLDYQGSRQRLDATIKADLAGSIGQGVGAAAQGGGGGVGGAAERQRIVIDARTRLGRRYAFENIDATAQLTGISTALIDVLGGFRGELAATMGPQVDVSLAATGNLQRGRGTVELTSQGAGATLKLDYDGTQLALLEPGRIWARSTGFLGGMDAAQAPVRRAGEQVRLDQAPGFDLLIESLRIPLTAQQLTAPGSLAEQLDLRGAEVSVRLRVEGFQGQVLMDTGADQARAAADWRPFQVQPLEAVLSSTDLAEGISLTASTRGTVDNQSAGAVDVDVQAGGLLDAQGRPMAGGGGGGLPRQLDGRIQLSEVSTQLVQPLLEGMNLPLDLRQDVGPQLDIVLTAATQGSQGPADAEAIPPTDLSASIASQNINGSAELRLERGIATTRGEGVQIRIASSVPLMQRILGTDDPATAFSLAGTGGLELAISNLRAPMDDRAAELQDVAADVDAQLRDVAVTVNGEQIQAPHMRLAVRFPIGAGPRASIAANLAHAGTPFQVTGDFELARLRDAWPMSPDAGPIAGALALRPSARLDIRGAPATLNRLAPGLEEPVAHAEDVAGHVRAMLRSLIGERVDVNLQVVPGDGAARITAAAHGGTGAVESAAVLSPQQLHIERAEILANLQPRDVDPILSAAAPPPRGQDGRFLRPPMQLRAPATLRVSVDPVAVPLMAESPEAAPSPDLAAVNQLVIRAAVDEPLVLDNVFIGEAPQTIALQGFTASAVAPGAALAAQADVDRDALRGRVDLSANILRGRGQAQGQRQAGGLEPLATLATSALFPLSLATWEATADLSDIRTAGLDALLDQPDMLAGALGQTARIRVNAAGNTSQGTMAAAATVESPRLTSTALNLAMDAEAIRLTQPAQLRWTPDVDWLNRMAMPEAPPRGDVIGRAPGEGPAPAPSPTHAARFTQIAPALVAIDRLVLSRPREADPATGRPERGPLLPGVFAMAVVVQTPHLELDPGGGGGGDGGAVVFQGVRTSAWSPPEPGSIGFDLVIEQVQGAGVTGEQRSLLSGRLARLADANGVLTTDRAEVALNGNLAAMPTPIIDALARQGGLLVEALGPTISVDVQAERVGPQAQQGFLRAQARSERATARIGGQIRNGVFVQTEPTQITLQVVTPQLINQLGASLPVVGTLEKRREDEPGVVRADNLTLPLDGDLRNLSGRISVDLGVARFTTTGGFAQLVRLAGAAEMGVVGRRLEPFVVNIDRGVASYDRFRLPLGEFSLETRGSVDLVQRRVDVVTYVPFFALTDEAAGALNLGVANAIGRVGIDRATLVPLRTHGSLESPRTEIATDLFIQEFGRGLLETPGRLIDDQIRRRLEDFLRPPGQNNPNGGGRSPPR